VREDYRYAAGAVQSFAVARLMTPTKQATNQAVAQDGDLFVAGAMASRPPAGFDGQPATSLTVPDVAFATTLVPEIKSPAGRAATIWVFQGPAKTGTSGIAYLNGARAFNSSGQLIT